MSVKRQLCINQIALPGDVLDVIKSYVFLDMVSYTTKIRKRSIHQLIVTSKWMDEYYYFRRYIYNFVICLGEDIKSPEYLINFCTKCGNYKIYRSAQNQKINCVC
jgi:hypothetical protein